MSGLGRLFRTTDEQIDPLTAKVKGTIPDWLEGSYLRAGPGVFDIGNFTVNHWCDGFGVIYKFDIKGGKVKFTKRIIQSDAYKKALSVGKPVYTELGTKAYSDTNKSIFQKVFSNVLPELTDNVGANLFKLGNSVYLATESCNMRILDTENLSTDKKVDISQCVNVNRLCSHMYIDPDGTGYTLGSGFSNSFKCQIIKIPPNESTGNECKRAESICTIPNRFSKSSSYAHSFGITENYIIYIEQPFFISSMKLITANMKGKSLLECMDWNQEESTRFIIVEKQTGKILTIMYEAERPFFFLHVVNCYEKDNEVVVDILCHDSPEVLDKLFLDQLRRFNFEIKDQATCRRYILPLIRDIKDVPEGTNLVKSDERLTTMRKNDKIIATGYKITEPNYDFPSLNRSYIGKEYQYFYATGLFGLSQYRGCLLKVDVKRGEVLTWKEADGVIPGEAAFVPRPGGTEEDDGVLVVGVTDTRTSNDDFLLILDAKTLTELARAEVACHVPHLIHAYFLPSSSS